MPIFHAIILLLLLKWGFSFHIQTRRCFRVPTELHQVSSATYLERMLVRKRIEVETLFRQHENVNDPLFMRMTYMNTDNNYNFTKAVKRFHVDDGEKQLQKLSVICDMKRKSPTVPEQRYVVDYGDAGDFAGLLTKSGFDAILVNTNELEYGGNIEDISKSAKAARAARPHLPPPIIVKDVILHPIQIAQAIEAGASGVLLILAVVGAQLESLLNSCTIMGVDAVVEVHTPAEIEYAIKAGATIFIVNMWDRTTGLLNTHQAAGVAHMFPFNCVRLAAGNIKDVHTAIELGECGYDGVVLGRGITELADIQKYVNEIHAYRGSINFSGSMSIPLTAGMNDSTTATPETSSGDNLS